MMSQQDDNPIANIDFSKWTLGSGDEKKAEEQVQPKSEKPGEPAVDFSNWSLDSPTQDNPGVTGQTLTINMVQSPTPSIVPNPTLVSEPDPSTPDEWIVMGEDAFADSDFGEAERCFVGAIRLNPISSMALSNLGVVYHTQGNLDVAERCYLKAAALDEHHADSFYGLAKLWCDNGDNGLALRYAARGLQRAPEHQELAELATQLAGAIDAQLAELHPA